MPGTRTPNLTLLPPLSEGLQAEAASLGLDLAVLVAILVRNDSIRPAKLARIEGTPRLSRVRVSCSMRAPTLRLANRGARRCALSRNAYLEALIDAHLAKSGPLIVLHSKSGAKL